MKAWVAVLAVLLLGLLVLLPMLPREEARPPAGDHLAGGDTSGTAASPPTDAALPDRPKERLRARTDLDRDAFLGLLVLFGRQRGR